MSNDFEKAKSIYHSFACNYFYMWKEGVLEEYKSFKVPSDVESMWRKNYIVEQLTFIENEKNMSMVKIYASYLINLLFSAEGILILKEFSNLFVNKGCNYDTLTKLVICESLQHELDNDKVKKDVKIEITKLISLIVVDLKSDKITIPTVYNESERLLDKSIQTDNIKVRISSLDNEITKYIMDLAEENKQ